MKKHALLYKLLRILLYALIRDKKEKFNRILPMGDYFIDRWEKARLIGAGKGTSIYDNVLIFGDVKIGENCWIGPNVILDGSGGLEIGNHTTIGANVQIYTHDNHLQTLSDAPSTDIPRKPVKIGTHTHIAPNTLIAMGTTIGDYVVIGACSFVNKDIPSHVTAFGIPAKIQSAKEIQQ